MIENKKKIIFPWWLKLQIRILGLGMGMHKITKPKRKAVLWGYVKTKK